MIHFLIDYENKNEYGLAGIRSLSSEDHVYILFSQNACKLDLNVISDTACSIHAIKVQPGRQSLDMHLVSCLGFLLNQYGTENDYYVVSDDTDFDRVIEFWKERGYRVSRVRSIEAALSPEEAEEAAAPAPAKKKRTSTRRTAASKGRKAAVKEEAETRTAVKEEAETGLPAKEYTEDAEAEIPAEAVNEAVPARDSENTPDAVDITLSVRSAEKTAVSAAAAAVKKEPAAAAAEEKDLSEEKNAFPEAEGSESNEAAEETSAKDGENEAEAAAAPAKPKRRKAPAKAKIKTEDESAQKQQPAAPKAKVQPESVAINSHIQKFLAQNKVNGAAINSIASIVAGNAGKKDRKALIYRQIIKKFGQKEGLEYYNLLKPEL